MRVLAHGIAIYGTGITKEGMATLTDRQRYPESGLFEDEFERACDVSEIRWDVPAGRDVPGELRSLLDERLREAPDSATVRALRALALSVWDLGVEPGAPERLEATRKAILGAERAFPDADSRERIARFVGRMDRLLEEARTRR